MKRTVGKNNTDVSIDDFYAHYISTVDSPVDRKTFGKFYKDLFCEFSNLILDGKEVRLNNIGGFKIIEYQPKIVKNGELNRKVLAPNWVATKEYWKELYPGKTLEELKLVPDKPLLYHENEHTNGQQYKFYWDKTTTELKCKSAYQFKPVRSSARRLSAILKDKNRKIFYYRK